MKLQSHDRIGQRLIRQIAHIKRNCPVWVLDGFCLGMIGLLSSAARRSSVNAEVLQVIGR
jgi:hypothetical protein